MGAPDTWLVTGGTGFVGGWLVRALVLEGKSVAVVARPSAIERVRRLVAAVESDAAGSSSRIQVVDGDVDQPLAGIRSDVLAKLGREVSVMVHSAAILKPRSQDDARRTNVEGTVAALEVARRLPALRRFVHVSSIAVAGRYDGRFYEDWLDVGQSFHGLYGPSKYEAEARVREARDLPTVIVRPGSVVNDSRTGDAWPRTTIEMAIRAMRRLSALPRFVPLPQPFSMHSRYPAVPVDYVARAIRTLVDVEAPPGRTYTLVEPDAPAIARVLDEVAVRVGAPRLRIQIRAAGPISKLSTVPILAPALRRAGIKVDFLQYLDRPHDHDLTNARGTLEPRGVVCPPLVSYLDRIVERSGGAFAR